MCGDKNVGNLIQAFGGSSAMARALGHAHASTVQSWKDRNVIPRWRIHEIRSTSLAKCNAEVQDMLQSLEQNKPKRVPEPKLQDGFGIFFDDAVTNDVIFASRESSGCRYILGDPKGDWSYCDRETRKGSPYCDHHHALCYRTVSCSAAHQEYEVAQKEADELLMPQTITVAPLLDVTDGESDFAKDELL